MNVQIPMSKGACIAVECLRAAGEGGSAEVLRHFGFVILSSFPLSAIARRATADHSDFVINISG